MPEMRTIASGDVLRVRPVTLEPCKRDPAAARRRYRNGGMAGAGNNTPGSLPVEVRNGLPEFRPYVYRGLGYDQLGDDDAET